MRLYELKVIIEMVTKNARPAESQNYTLTLIYLTMDIFLMKSKVALKKLDGNKVKESDNTLTIKNICRTF